MALFQTLKDALITPPELKLMAEIYGDSRVWNVLIKVHSMRIAQLGEEMMSTNTMTPEGQIKEHGLKERVAENEYYLDLFKRERTRQEKILRNKQRDDVKQKRYQSINKLTDL
jgi:hypothetical protein